MRIILLDGVGAGILLFLFGLGLLFIIIAILLEAMIMQWMKMHASFKVALPQSVGVNIASLASGFVLSSIDSDLFHLNNMAGFGVMFLVTVIIEFILLYLMNKKEPVKKILLICLAMNMATYLAAFILIQGIFN